MIGQTFARTGHIRLVGWGRFFLIGQFVVLGPFARSLLVQQLFVAGLAAVGLVATFDLLRPFTGPTRAAVAVLTLSLWPGFGLLATSFMGEVPAFAGALACLAIGQRAIRSLSVPVLVSAAVVGLWAMTTREQAVIAPISVLLVFASAARRRSLRALLSAVGTGVVFAGLACVLEKWRLSLPHGDHFVMTAIDPKGAREFATRAVTLLALAALPAALFAWRNPLRAKGASGIGAVAAALIAVEAYRLPGHQVFIGNYLNITGAYGDAYAAVAPLFSPHTWALLRNLAIVAVPIVALPFARSVRRAPPLLATFGGILAVVLFVERCMGQYVWDRNLLTLLPVVVGIVLLPALPPNPASDRTVRTRQKVTVGRALNWILAGLGCLTMGTLATAITLDGLTRDAQVWKVADRLVRNGTPPSSIDAGLDWVGFRTARPVLTSGGALWRSSYWRLFQRRTGCLIVAPAPIAGVNVVDRVPYRRYLVGGEAAVYVSQTGPCP